MKRLVLLCLLALPACKQDRAALPAPVELTAEAVGFYCQMNLLEHDGPKAQVHLDGLPAPLFFSQVRDAVAYLHMPEQSHAVRAVYVQDMSGGDWHRPGPWTEVSKAVYVLGSDMRGGMDAAEFVPFADARAAAAFARAHGGQVRALADITGAEALGALPDPAAPQADPPEADTTDDIAARLGALSARKGQ